MSATLKLFVLEEKRRFAAAPFRDIVYPYLTACLRNGRTSGKETDREVGLETVQGFT